MTFQELNDLTDTLDISIVEVLYFNAETNILTTIIWENFSTENFNFSYKGYLIRKKFNIDYKKFLEEFLDYNENLIRNYTESNLTNDFRDWFNLVNNPLISYKDYKIDDTQEVNEISLSLPLNSYSILLHLALQEKGYLVDEDGEEHPIKYLNTSKEHLSLNILKIKKEDDGLKISYVSLINLKEQVRTLHLGKNATAIVNALKEHSDVVGWTNPRIFNEDNCKVDISTLNSTLGYFWLEVNKTLYPLKKEFESVTGKELIIKILTDNFYTDIRYAVLRALNFNEGDGYLNQQQQRTSEALMTQASYIDPFISKIYPKTIYSWLKQMNISTGNNFNRDILKSKLPLLKGDLERNGRLNDKSLNSEEIKIIIDTLYLVTNLPLTIKELLDESEQLVSMYTINNVAFRVSLIRIALTNLTDCPTIQEWDSLHSNRRVLFEY